MATKKKAELQTFRFTAKLKSSQSTRAKYAIEATSEDEALKQLKAQLEAEKTGAETETKEEEKPAAKKAAPKKAAPKKAAEKKAAPKKGAAKKKAAPKKAAAKKKAAPKKAAAKKKTTPKADAEQEKVEAADEKPKPKRTRSRKKKKDDAATAAPRKGAEKKGADADKVEASDEKPKPKRTRSRKKKDDAATAAAAAAPSEGTAKKKQRSEPREPVKPPMIGEAGTTWLKDTLKAMGIARPRIKVDEDDERVTFTVTGYQTETLLGQLNASATTGVLDALQALIGKALLPRDLPSKIIIVDVAGFRDQRTDEVAAAAQRVGELVKATGRSARFAIMNAIDRRAFHMSLRGTDGIDSESDGRGVFRRLKVFNRS